MIENRTFFGVVAFILALLSAYKAFAVLVGWTQPLSIEWQSVILAWSAIALGAVVAWLIKNSSKP